MDDLVTQAMTGQLDKETALRRITIQQAVSRRINCPDCGCILDQHRTTVVEKNGRPAGISCHKCYSATMQRTAKACAGRDEQYIRSMLNGLSALNWLETTDCADRVLRELRETEQMQQMQQEEQQKGPYSGMTRDELRASRTCETDWY